MMLTLAVALVGCRKANCVVQNILLNDYEKFRFNLGSRD
jgi:hypothetical protein